MRFLSDFVQAFDNLRAQKTRTLLTTLGIVFGVGSVAFWAFFRFFRRPEPPPSAPLTPEPPPAG